MGFLPQRAMRHRFSQRLPVALLSLTITVLFGDPLGLASRADSADAPFSPTGTVLGAGDLPGLGIQVLENGIDPNAPLGDLDGRLDRLIANAGIVAIGEPIHGSHGFMLMQHRLVRYLVERKGFRTIVVENGSMRTEGIEKWLRSCPNRMPAPVDLLALPYEESKRLLEWICAFNSDHPNDRVSFHGMDIWDRPWEHQNRIDELVEELALNLGDVRLAKRHCWMHEATGWSQMKRFDEILREAKDGPPKDLQVCLQALESMRNAVIDRLNTTSDRSRTRAYLLLQSINTSIGWQGHNATRVPANDVFLNTRIEGFNARELAQARNELAIWQASGRSKMVILAHSSHAGMNTGPAQRFSFIRGVSDTTLPSNINYLKKLIQDSKIVTIGLTGYKISGWGGALKEPIADISLDLTLHNLHLDTALIDPHGEFSRKRPYWGVQFQGQGDGTDMSLGKLAENFDAYIFVNSTPEGTRTKFWREIFAW